MAMHALTMLKADHRKVETLFKAFENAEAKSKKASIVKQIITELSMHASVEEQVFYPAIREALGDRDEHMVLEALEEHHVAKWLLNEINKMTPDDERFDAKVTVLMENIKHHVKEEEEELFKKVRKAMSVKALNEVGNTMALAKKVAPKKPHPRAPDTPPGNILAGIGAGLVDRAFNVVRGLAKTDAKKTVRRGPHRAAERGSAGRGKASRTRKTGSTRASQ